VADADADADAGSRLVQELEERTWTFGALVLLATSGAVQGDGSLTPSSPAEVAAARVLVAAGLATEADGAAFDLVPDLAAFAATPVFAAAPAAMRSSFGQLASVLGIASSAAEDEGWASQSDDTLRAQGKASAMGGRMLATMVVPMLAGLADRFADGGDFLDVGVGVAELTAAFCDALPSSRVVGLDVMPRVLGLAAETLRARGLTGRVELRELGVQELDDRDRFDLAWLPAPFIPEPFFDAGLPRVVAALRPGGWLVVGAGRLEGEPLPVALTRWQTLVAGGTALTRADAEARLGRAGLESFLALPTPPGAPMLYAARRPPS
jgi:predicted O-methyltransferase YrrM